MEQSYPPPPPSLFPDSADSSPRSRPDTTWDVNDNPLPSKLRLMCSYGGHIIPRPHDKSLCYVGGDTRIVVVDRHSSLPDLHSRLSHTLLNGRHFSLKYQLPNEDLDSLISIATNEDLENMMEEYDRSAAAKPSRLRLFLFPSKPETTLSMGSLLDDAKSETWFVDALNGSGGLLLPRGLSESAAMDTLVELEVGNGSDYCTDLEASKEINSKQQVEASNSSFGSSSSSPSMANLPPIRVRGSEEYSMVGLDEQFSQAKLGENWDEKAGVMRKPPLPLPLPQRKLVDVYNLPSPDSKHAAAGSYNLPSPDSVASDNGSVSKHTIYQDATQVLMKRENKNSSPPPPPLPNADPNVTTTTQDPITSQQHFIPNTHYISSYYPTMYLHPQTDPQIQYPMYVDVASTRPVSRPETMQQQQVLVHVTPHHQFQQQQQHYIGHVSQIPPPNNYGYEYSTSHQHHHVQMQDQHQGYYGQQIATSATPPPPQYQTMTPAAAALIFSQPSAQLPPPDNTSHQS